MTVSILRNLLRALCVIVLATACGACAQSTRTTSEVPRAPAKADQPKPASPSKVSGDLIDDRAERIVDAMSVTDQVGQLIMTDVTSTKLQADERTLIASGRIGGIILFGFNYASDAQLAGLLADAQRTAEMPLLIAVDQEGGAIRNVPSAPPDLTAPQIAHAGSIARSATLARTTGAATARALHGLGINVVLGPVADLVSGPARVVNGRSFGTDSAQVARLVQETIAGIQADHSVAATVKHFPGFGGSDVNTDNGVGHVRLDRATLMQRDIAPFRAAVDAGVDVVMVTHAIYDGLGATLPATIAPQVIRPLLRGELGFAGVVMTDSMNAAGLRDAWSGTVPTACVAAVRSGVDVVLLTGSVETARLCHARLLDAVIDRRITRAELRASVLRVVRLKLRLGLHRQTPGGTS